MTNIIDRLALLDGPLGATDETTVTTDLDRGRRAAARRRHKRAGVAGVGLTLVLGSGLGAVVVFEQPDPVTAYEQPNASAHVDLVAFEGEQPEGFEIAKIPEGFVAQGSNPFSFTIAREGDTSHPDNFENKLVVFLESSHLPPGQLDGDPVTVNGEPGAVLDPGDGALRLEFHDGSQDVDVIVQMSDSVGLSVEQLVEFAEGITVTSDVAGR